MKKRVLNKVFTQLKLFLLSKCHIIVEMNK